jgi:hypothetical protein
VARRSLKPDLVLRLWVVRLDFTWKGLLRPNVGIPRDAVNDRGSFEDISGYGFRTHFREGLR